MNVRRRARLNTGTALRLAGFVFTLLAAVSGLSVRAESPSFKVYTTQEGLAHDRINNIVRDSRGFLWFCTSEGLSRFDGARFTNFTTDQGLPHRNVNTFYETRNGTYLVGTSNGVAIFNPNGTPYRWNVLEKRLEQNGDAPPMFRSFLPSEDRQTNIIHGMAEDPDGNLLIGSASGLFRGIVSDSGLTFELIDIGKEKAVGFYKFLDDHEGGMLSVSSYGIYRIYKGKGELLERPGAGSIMRAADGKIWIGASGEPTGIRIYDFANGRLSLVRRYTKNDGLLADTFQGGLWQLKDGSIFVGLETGFQQFVPDAKESEPKFRTYGGDTVNSLAEDPVGNLWLGTELKGAWQLVRSGFVSFGEKDGVPESEDIRAIYVSRSGEIFLPARPRRILRLQENGIFAAVYPSGLTGRSWGWSNLDFESVDGEWWIAANDGLRRYPKVARFEDLANTPPKKIYTKEDGLHGNEIFILFEDSRGDVWITTDAGGGHDCLARWDRKTDTFVRYFCSDGGLPSDSGPVSFAEDNYGNVWIGFYFGGISRYKDGHFQFFTAKDGMAESMPGTLYIDDAGRLWIGTSGEGLYRVDETNAEQPVFTSISTRDGLSSNQVICLTGDKFHQVYAGTGRGINRLDQNGNIEVFTQADGLPSNYITRCAADKTGALWFVSRNTLVRYTPEQKQSIVPGAVYIDKVSVNGNPQRISALGETEINLPDLTYDQNQIQISFFALTFGAGEDIRYQYRLDEQEWSQPTGEQTINLNLPSSKHSFAVRAVRADGATSPESAVLNLRILSPIWQRWWFVSLAALFVTGIVLGTYRYRITNLRRINAALLEANRAEEELRRTREERVAELEQVRSRIATDLHDDIGSSLTQIAVLSEVAQTQAGKGNGQPDALKKITDVSNELVGTMSDIVWAINPAKDHLSDLTQRMRRVAADLLSPKGIAVHFRSREEDRAVTIRTNARREVFLIFKESINNIAKHSGAKNVEIDLEIKKDLLLLKIQDDGRGFVCGPPSFEDTLSSEGPSGNGIRNMRKRAAEMGGRFDIDSSPGRGTISFLELPLGTPQTTEF
jgi:signal transduction histidine kinase/ligand-binding sensor domain-containing protein